jgi:alanyl-tRNA synthetase
VGPEHFRFDFSHPVPLSERELKLVEDMVNGKILEGISVNTCIMEYKEAIEKGALAFFGEKYGERVRVVSIGDFSKELCGGTHLKNTALTGIFKIISESSIAAGIRRIEALTGRGAKEYLDRIKEKMDRTVGILDIPPERLPEYIDGLVRRAKRCEKTIEKFEARLSETIMPEVQKNIVVIDGIKIAKVCVDGTVGMMRMLAGKLRATDPELAGIIISREGERLTIVAFSGDKIKEKIPAGKIASIVGKAFGGGGGGRKEMGEAGAKIMGNFEGIFQKIEKMVVEAMR